MTPSPDTAASAMPVWTSKFEIDPAWMAAKTSLPCKRCVVTDISNDSKKSTEPRLGTTLRVLLDLDGDVDADVDRPSDADAAADAAADSTTTTQKLVVIKQVSPQAVQLSKYLGLAREALFFSQLAPKLKETESADSTQSDFIPHIYHSWGDMATGEKVVIMEDLSHGYLDSGVFFGPGNPNNWNRDLPAMVARAGDNPPSSEQVAEATFKAIAQVHASFWQDKSLVEYGWLRGCQWLQGEGKDSWEASQQIVKGCWSKYLSSSSSSSSSSSPEGQDGVANESKHNEAEHKKAFRWDPLVRETVEKAVDGISWDAQVQRLNESAQWTLVHGDFWPGNVLWDIASDGSNSDSTNKSMIKNKNNLKLLDWEMCGVGSGPQDLGQYILSNMDPVERRGCEERLVRMYFAELQLNGVTSMAWDECWREYRVGGLERWLWFLVYFLGQDGMSSWAQFFHDQIAAFMHDHGLSKDDVTQPRP